MEYCRSLRFDQEPDYKFLLGLFGKNRKADFKKKVKPEEPPKKAARFKGLVQAL